MQASAQRAVWSAKRFLRCSWVTRVTRAVLDPSARQWARAWPGAVCALIACVFVYPDPARADELWRGLEVGASVKSVRHAFPDATQPLSPVTLADGETDNLTTYGLFLGDRLMEVRFFFRENGLTSVQLAPVAVGTQTRAANLRLAEALSARLTARYGAPFDCGDRTSAGVGLYACKWLNGPIIVRLWYLDAAGTAASLRIAFRKADDAAYDF
jgi:hypothetical protein